MWSFRTMYIFMVIFVSIILTICFVLILTAKNSFEEDWVVVQTSSETGKPTMCWKAHGRVSQDEGILYLTNTTDVILTVSGSHRAAKVIDKDWNKAYKLVGITQEECDQLSSQK